MVIYVDATLWGQSLSKRNHVRGHMFVSFVVLQWFCKLVSLAHYNAEYVKIKVSFTCMGC